MGLDWGARRARTLVAAGIIAVLALLAGGIGASRAATDPLSSDALMSTVHAYSTLAADHLSGTSTEARTQSWLTSQLQGAGALTGADAYSFLAFKPTKVGLTLRTRAPRDVPDVAPYYYSGVTDAGGITAPLADAGFGTAAELATVNLASRIAVVEVPNTATLAPAFNAVQQAGAVGLILVTDGPEDYPVNQDVDSRAGIRGLPTLIVGRRNGAALRADGKDGVIATLTLTATIGRACDTDIWGVLPGQDPDRYVVVGTPTSAFDPAASERGAGVAVLVALARRYGALPRAQRPVGLVFAGLSGHEVGYLGLPILMQTHPDWFSMADAYVHLGASIAALAATTDPSGGVHQQSTGDTSRALYISENPVLASGTTKAFTTAGAEPIAEIPPSVQDPGEQSVAYAAGVPIVGESGSSAYFHTAGDSERGVGAGLLAAQARAFAATVDFIVGSSPHQTRNANLVASSLRDLRAPSTTPTGTGPVIHQPVPVASCADPTPTQPPRPTTSAPTINPTLDVVPGYENQQPGFAWEGRWQEVPVTWASTATKAQLSGVMFAPNPPPRHPVPAVVIVPGSGPGVQSFYQWAARDLAGHGYVALTVDPQGVGQSAVLGSPACELGPARPGQATPCAGVPWQQDGNYLDAAESGVDFLVSPANPFAASTDVTKIGVAGHSLGARAVSYAQGIDKRIDAVVAWDNLASDLNGDAGSASGGPPLGNLIGGELPGPAMPVTPRVPSLGEASDSSPNPGADVKKTAYDQWVAAKVASMEVVFAGAVHNDWAQSSLSSATASTSLQRFEYYTRAWFDLWLRHDSSAVARLTSPAMTDYLSSKFHSALYLPGQIDIPDLRGR